MRLFNLIKSLGRIRPSTPTPTQTPTVKETPWERQVFHFLCRAAAASGTPVELRVAGGWVRDKLLGRPAGDIDIAVRHASGVQFAAIVEAYIARNRRASNNTQRAGDDNDNDNDNDHSQCTTSRREVASQSFMGPCEYIPQRFSAFRVEVNPDNSRHLETAAVILDGQSLDFVQLRTEDYITNPIHTHTNTHTPTRIPHTTRPATPEEDALRRDFTVNALFYNLHTRTVEDCTGDGLRDLTDAVLRTPLNPTTTLQDDPLRALRALRFASTLGFSLAPALHAALASPHLDLPRLLTTKVSRERVGIELMHIVTSPRPVDGLRRVADYGLVRAVFCARASAAADAMKSAKTTTTTSTKTKTAATQVQVLHNDSLDHDDPDTSNDNRSNSSPCTGTQTTTTTTTTTTSFDSVAGNKHDKEREKEKGREDRFVNGYRQRVDNVRDALRLWANDAPRHFSGTERDAFERPQGAEHAQRTALLFALVVGEVDRIRPVVRSALRGTKTLARDVRTLLNASDALWTCWTLRDQREGTMDDETWLDMAELLRHAGEHLYIAAVIHCAVANGHQRLFSHLLDLGLNAPVCRLTPALDGNTLQHTLGLEKGPDVGRAKKTLIRLQLRRLRRQWQQRQANDNLSQHRNGNQNTHPADSFHGDINNDLSTQDWIDALKAAMSTDSKT